jgi:ABC-type transport system substrate-binding protein
VTRRVGGNQLLWAVTIGFALILLTACGGPPTPVFLSPDQATQTAQPPTLLPVVSPVDAPVDGLVVAPRTLRLAVASFSGYDPLAALDAGTEQVQALIYEPLLAYDSTGVLEPLLAADLPIVSADDLQWTVTLREGVFFHDGAPFDGPVAAASLEAVRAGPADGVSWPLAALAFRQVVAGISGEGMTLTIDLLTPYPTLPDLLADSALAITHGQAIGTGPFRLAELGADSLSFEAFAGYHGGPPLLAGVQVVVLDPSEESAASLLDMLTRDSVDLVVVEGFVPDDLPPGFRQQDLTMPESWLLFNRRVSPFDREAVRLALATTTDDRVWALELLAAAGYPDGFDLLAVDTGARIGFEALAARFGQLNVNLLPELRTEAELLAGLHGTITGDLIESLAAFAVSWRRDWVGRYWLLLAGWDADTLPEQSGDHYGVPLPPATWSMIVRDGLAGLAETTGGWPRVAARTILP